MNLVIFERNSQEKYPSVHCFAEQSFHWSFRSLVCSIVHSSSWASERNASQHSQPKQPAGTSDWQRGICLNFVPIGKGHYLFYAWHETVPGINVYMFKPERRTHQRRYSITNRVPKRTPARCFIPRLNAKNDVTSSNKLLEARGFSDSQTSKSALGHFIQIA